MTVPIELQRSTPRPVALTFWGKAAALSFCLLLVAFIAETGWIHTNWNHEGSLRVADALGIYLLIALAINLWKLPRHMRLLSGGRAALARTTGDYKRVKFTGRQIRRYRLECQFTAPNGTRSKTTVVTNKWLPANTEVVIVYDPDEPKKAAIYPTRMLKIEEN
jgi:hypothetical protein